MMIAKLRTFVRLPGAQRALLFEAGTALLIGAVLAVVPLRWYARWLGVQQVETPLDDADSRESVRLIGWAIRLIAERVPFRSDCLPQAIAARVMLGRRRIPVTVYFGTAFKAGTTTLYAHAWARSGSVVLTGNQPRRRFQVVATFAHQPKA